MEPTVHSDHHVRFKMFELDLRTRELRRNGIRLKLKGQPIDVLEMLLDKPGELVTREQLRRKLWPEDTFVDFEHSLNSTINRLRDALGDRAEDPRFIETLPRLGYRFIAPVDLVMDGDALPGGSSEAAPVESNPAVFHPDRRLVTATIGLVCTLAAAVVAVSVTGLPDRLHIRIPVPWRANAPRVESLAVLPFENLSSDADQEYFADGMTEELITNLASISSIRVISRASVMRFKTSRKPLPEIARELNVDGIIEGTVARSGNHIRITANLLHAPTDRHLWANSYETDMEDVLVTQGKVAHAIADALRVELAPPSALALGHPRRVNPEAYDALLKGWYLMSKSNQASFEKGAASFRRSIDLDPTYARAYHGLADYYLALAVMGLRPASDALPLAKAATLKALELDNGLGDAHATLGQIKMALDWDWAGAEAELLRAIQVSPNSSLAHIDYGMFLVAMGRRDESVSEGRKALELDPLDLDVNLQLGWIFYYARRYDEAIAQLKKTLELDPSYFFAYAVLGWNYAQKGMYSEAASACRKALDLEPEEQVTLGSCGFVFGLAGMREEALSCLARIKRVPERSYLDPYNVAWLYAGLGDTSNTMVWLERAYREHSASLWDIKAEILPDGVRADPRFQDLLRRMKFPP